MYIPTGLLSLISTSTMEKATGKLSQRTQALAVHLDAGTKQKCTENTAACKRHTKTGRLLIANAKLHCQLRASAERTIKTELENRTRSELVP
jgi:hypothetical protein